MRFRDLARSLPCLIALAILACNSDDLIAPTTGTLEITTATVGAEPDPDGYTVQVDGESPRAIGAGAQLRLEAAAGDHSVRLDGIAGNCAVDGENPRQVVLTAGATSPVNFSVTCGAGTGALVVTSSSSGFFPDPDGYLVTVDGGTGVAIGGSDQLTLPGLSSGSHQVGLSGLIANCRVQGENPRPLEIVGGESAALTFEVECAPPAIAFRSTRSRPSSIFLVNPDGTGLVRLPSTTDEYRPVWSPDGPRLAFVSFTDLYVMTPGAGDRTRLFPAASAGGERAFMGGIRWSPDGGRIAFDVAVDSVCAGLPCLREQLWVVNSDGTGLRKLAGGHKPSWSPDGQTIAFGSDAGLFLIGADGSGLRQLTVPLAAQPAEAAWSPDGSRLLFSAVVNSSLVEAIFTIKPDGTGLVRLTPEGGYDTGPQWSPDGSRIAFRSDATGAPGFASGLGVMNADGSGRSIVSGQPLYDLDFTWSPDGQSIALTVDVDFEIGDTDVYVVNLDGSGLTNLARNPAGDAEVSWR